MDRFLERTQDSDYLAEVVNDYIAAHAPDEWKRFCTAPPGDGATEFLITDNLEIAATQNIPVHVEAYVRWRDLEPIPYTSNWHWDQKAIPHILTIDARPEIQAEFKRRGITPR